MPAGDEAARIGEKKGRYWCRETYTCEVPCSEQEIYQESWETSRLRNEGMREHPLILQYDINEKE